MDIFKNGGAWPVKDGSITMSTGKAVGGSTLMYTGVTFRLPDDVCKDTKKVLLEAEMIYQKFNDPENAVNLLGAGAFRKIMRNPSILEDRRNIEVEDLPKKIPPVA